MDARFLCMFDALCLFFYDTNQSYFQLNEPDINNISPQQAVDWYLKRINPMTIRCATYLSSLCPRPLIIHNPSSKALPAVTSSTQAGKGLNWLQSFLNICNGRCYFDYINLHCTLRLFLEPSLRPSLS